MRISRMCYDKAHRCPGWAGGGPHYPRGESRCDGGHINFYTPEWERKRFLWIRLLGCDKCDVRVLPRWTRWLDPGWLKWKLDDLRGWLRDPAPR